MSSSLLVTLEIFGVLGVVLLLGGWELWTLRRDKVRDKLEKHSPASQETADSTAGKDAHPAKRVLRTEERQRRE